MQSQRRTTRRRPRAVLAVGAALMAAATATLTPTAATAAPADAAEAAELVAKAAQQLTVIEAQVHEAEDIVAAQQDTAATAAAQAEAARQALAVHEPQIRAIAKSTFYEQESRVATFLVSDSPEDLVQQMATLDMIAAHTNSVIAEVAAARSAAEQAQVAADQAAADAQASLDQLEAQHAEVERRAAEYQSDLARLSAAEQDRVSTLVAGPTLATPDASDLPVAPNGAAATAIEVALSKVGLPYRMGASGPSAFDCSGLTSYAYAAAGVTLPRSSRAQSQIGRQVGRGELQPGDLVFYYTPISHVALYIGNGQIVHARTYGTPLSVTTVDQGGFRFGVRLTG
ncbi:NlpC/P60 family protein [Blastococcus sp. TBT05-19]|uniref:C40 family peptidase n=1 Tax=Blastococcus sp. TBT05-19 TaxID=2250581 RepID=UPI000DE9D2C8|nr:C40 family peptidase [Blastococcus sp. TBT05-19]RBY92128.1 NlpC/P60 family protein [Blastococcus sp. TBT05-19]